MGHTILLFPVSEMNMFFLRWKRVHKLIQWKAHKCDASVECFFERLNSRNESVARGRSADSSITSGILIRS